MRRKLGEKTPTPTQAPRNSNILDQIANIQKTLSIPGTVPRSASRQSTVFDPVDSVFTDNPLVTNLLNQIQTASWNMSEKFDALSSENDSLKQRVKEYITALNDQQQENEGLREDGEIQIDELKQELDAKDRELLECNNYIQAIHDEMENVKLLIDDMEQDREQVGNLRELLELKNSEYQDLENQYATLQKEFQSVKEDIDTIQNKLNIKDKELSELKLAYSNNKEDSKNLTSEIKLLQNRIKSLKTDNDNLTIESLADGISSVSISNEHAKSIISSILSKMKSVMATQQQEDVTIENMNRYLDMFFEEYAETRLISSKLEESTQQNTDLFQLLEEKEDMERALGNKLRITEKELERLKNNDTINSKPHSETVEKLKDEVDNLRAQLDDVQNEEFILREELNAVHQDLKEAQFLNAELKVENSQFQDKAIDSDGTTQENFQQLHEDFEKAIERVHELESSERTKSTEMKNLQETKNNLTSQVETLQNSNRDYIRQIGNLNSEVIELNDKQQSLSLELQEKLHTLNDLSREKTHLSREHDILNNKYAEQLDRASSLESQLFNALHSNTSASSVTANSTGSKLKEQAYHRMIELETEVQASREKCKNLEEELKRNDGKYKKRSREFTTVLRDIVTIMSNVSDKEWANKMTDLMEDTRKNPGYFVENFSKIGSLIRDGIKALDTKKKKYKTMAEGLKAKQKVLLSNNNSNNQNNNSNNKPHFSGTNNFESGDPELNLQTPGSGELKAFMKNLSEPAQQPLDTQALDSVGGEIALKVWEYRYRNMRDRFEKEREARKLEHENYLESIKQMEDKLTQNNQYPTSNGTNNHRSHRRHSKRYSGAKSSKSGSDRQSSVSSPIDSPTSSRSSKSSITKPISTSTPSRVSK